MGEAVSLTALVALWVMSAILFFTDTKRESLRWASALCFLCGTGYLGVILEAFVPNTSGISKVILLLAVSVSYSFSHQLAPYSHLMFCVTYSNLFKKQWSKWRYKLMLVLLVPPILMYFVLPFYPEYIGLGDPNISLYFLILAIWVVPYVSFGNFLLILAFFKEQNEKTKRQIILSAIIVTPTTTFSLFSNYILKTFGIYDAWKYIGYIIVFQAIAFIIFGFKYGVLGYRIKYEKYYIPIERILDNISDAFVIIDKKFNIIEMNQTFTRNFGNTRKDDSFLYVLGSNPVLSMCKQKFIQSIKDSNDSKGGVVFEEFFNDTGKFFEIEITPVYANKKYLATVILFKDISEHKKVINFIEQNQNKIIEDERLKSLGQLMGGIAHNLKTPIMACSGGVGIIGEKIKECNNIIEQMDESLELKEKYKSDIIDEMLKWEKRIKDNISYMDNVIDTVKGQAAPTVSSENDFFTVEKLVDSINILMKIHIKKALCKIKFDMKADENLRITGKIEYLVQVLNNLILNAIQSYDDKGGPIEFIIKQDEENSVCFSIRDYGKGMSLPIQKKLFNQMITTKGKNGTGLGLYISKSFITGKFGGEIKFESVQGEGSTFTVIIPLGGENRDE